MRAIWKASFVSLFAGPAAAGVLTVGPAGPFAEIQDAIDAASPGDVILVAPGTYGSIDVALPLRILGDGSGPVVIAALGDNGISVSGIAAGEEVVLSGIEVQAFPIFPSVPASILLQSNPGTVVLHDILIDYVDSQVGVNAQASARVLILGSEILNAGASQSTSSAAVIAAGSHVWISDSTITGRKAGSFFIEPGGRGVKITNGTLHVWRSTIRGGDASPGKPGLLLQGAGGHGVEAIGSSVNLFGGPLGEVTGGDGEEVFFFTENPGGNGVRLVNGSVARIQDRIPITGGIDGDGVTQAADVFADGSSSFTLDPKTFPTLVSDPPQVATGGSIQLGLEGSPSSFTVLFVSFETGPTLTLPGVESLGVLNPALFLQLAVTPLDPAGQATVNALVPAVPALLGFTFFFQFAEAAGPQLAISSPALVVVTATP